MVFVRKVKTLIRLAEKHRAQMKLVKKYKLMIAKKARVDNVGFEEYCGIAHHAEVSNSSIGKRTSIGRYTKVQYSKIGRYCSVSWNVTIGALAHNMNKISSHSFVRRKEFGIVSEDAHFVQPETIVGNDVWIGCNAVIVSGVYRRRRCCDKGCGAILGCGRRTGKAFKIQV